MRAKPVMLLSALLITASLAPASALASSIRPVDQPAIAPSGLALSVDGARSLPLPNGCAQVQTDRSGALASVAVYAVAGRKATSIRLGPNVWKLAAGQSFSAVGWLPLSAGTFRACMNLADLRSKSLKLLAHTAVPKASFPGGLVDVSARIPLATTGSTAGKWTIPPDAVAAGAGGLILQVASSRSGVVQVRSGPATVRVAVGGTTPASTLILPPGRLSWTSSSKAVRPTALLLGYVTRGDDSVDGGALVNVLAKPATVAGSVLRLAGAHGLPAATARIPATSVLGTIIGAPSSVEDSLAAGRRTPSGSVRGRGTTSLFRLSQAGTVNFTSPVTMTVAGWLGGDVVRAADSADLSLPGSPKVIGRPASNRLRLAGRHRFKVGETLVIGVSKYSPNGLIAVVTSVSLSATSTVISFRKGALLNAFDRLSVVAQIPAAPRTGKTVADPRRTALHPGDVIPSLGTSFGLDFSFSKSVDLTDAASADVSLDFAPSLTLSISVGTNSWGFPTSASLHYALDTTTTMGASLTFGHSWSGSHTFGLPGISLTPIDLGWVVVVPKLSSSLQVSASVSATVTLAGKFSEHTHDGMNMTAGGSRGFSFSGDPNNGFGHPSFESGAPEVSIGASASATLSLDFALAVEDVAGPDASADATLGIDVSPQSTPDWKVTASADFSIGLDLDALNLGILDHLLHLLGIPTNPNWSIGHLGPYVLGAGSGGSTGGPTGGGGGGSGSGGPTGGGGSGGGGGGGGGLTTAPPGATVSIGQGPAAPFGFRYAITLTGYVPNSQVGVECFDSQDPGGFYFFILNTDGSGNASTQSYCYSAAGPDYWVVAGGLGSAHIRWNAGSPPPVPSGSVQIGWSGSFHGWIFMTLRGFPAGSYHYTCDFGSGGDKTFTLTADGSAETFDNGRTCFDLEPGDTVWVTVDGVQSNTIIVGGAPATKGLVETTGGVTNTWSDFSDAGGGQGPTIQSGMSVVVSCAVPGFTVADGNTWWYQIASSPWSNSYYASADAFYNDGATSGSLIGTPFVDPKVPDCNPSAPPPTTWAETTGGAAHTWTNYTNAGGTQGATIPAFDTVQITCALPGFKVADGNTWWYQIASSPWNNVFFVSADAFYNNGATSGPLKGTPFVDPAVAQCSSTGHAETTGGAANTWTDYTDAGGAQGPTIGGGATVTVTCARQGFKVADGNTWWYKIDSQPWGNQYYASADAFYNNGATSGPLKGTPFVDPAVPLC